MRLMVEFKRFGPARYVSHLDLQRTVMRAVRRTKLCPEYSKGFNPHMVLSFASAMSVGLISDSEYFEIKLVADTPAGECLAELKNAMPPGIEPVFAGVLPEGAPKLMAALMAASYTVQVQPDFYEKANKWIENLLQSDNMVVETVRNGAKSVRDIRPLIHTITAADGKFDMLLSASSEGTLNPEVLLRLMTEQLGDFDYTLRRTSLYCRIGGELKPLRDLCK